MSKEKRDTVVKSLRLKPEELSRIQELAKKSGMTFNAYVVKSASEQSRSDYPPRLMCYLRDISTILATHDHMLTDEMKKRLILEADYICKTLSNS